MKSIKKRILSVALSIIIVSLLLTTAVGGFLSYSNTIKTLDATMSELATTTAKQIESSLDKSKVALSEIGTVSRLSNPSVTLAEKKDLLSAKTKQHGFMSLDVADLTGTDLSGNNIANEDFFKEAVKGTALISNLQVVQDKNISYLTVAAPLWDNGVANSKVVGVVYAELSGEVLSQITSDITIGKTGSAYMLDKDGYVISHKKYELVLGRDNTILSAQTDKSLNVLASIEKTMTTGKTGFGEYRYNGVSKFLTYAPVGNTDGWSVAINVEKNEFVSATYFSMYIALGLSILLIILASVMFILFANSITKPIKEIEAAAKEMSKGNLDISINHTGKDELGQLASSFNQTIQRLNGYISDIARCCSSIAKGNFNVTPEEEFSGDFIAIQNALTDIVAALSETMGEISISAEQVSSGSNQVSCGAQALAQGATEQASAIEELSASIEEIAEQAKKNATNASAANMQATSVGNEVHTCNEKMEQMLHAMSGINESSEKIARIIKTIEDIAFQTNILALNAAVEAARAGAAGKGFAVVADEVRNLASKSAAAATDTTALIEQSMKTVESGASIADETAKSLMTLVSGANEIIGLIEGISSASNEQAMLIGEITQGVEQISAVVQTNSATAEESSAASEELTAQAESLKQLVSQFELHVQ